MRGSGDFEERGLVIMVKARERGSRGGREGGGVKRIANDDIFRINTQETQRLN